MTKYYDSITPKVREYFNVLSEDFPEWLNEYIATPALQRIGHISMDCGCDYSALFPNHPWYSNLDHSVGVALIIWHFTKDKAQTLSGLLHDIATPVFKHCIDFMNGDTEHQESTEERTESIIRESKELMELLNRDNITVEQVADYKIYPIADNSSPCLSADRFEYNFSSGLLFHDVWTIETLKECYDDVSVMHDEKGQIELGFNTISIAEKYVKTLSKLWPWWINDADRISMQFLADTCKEMNEKGFLTIDDLYTLPEKEIIEKVYNCGDEKIARNFKKYQEATVCFPSDELVEDKYCINVKAKRRYINPLVSEGDTFGRIADISEIAKNAIDEYMQVRGEGYVYFDFNLEK